MGGPVRVLHVVVNMNRGGAETLIMNLYRNMDLEKVQFDFLTCKEGVFDQEIINMGGKVHRISYVTEVGHSGYIRELKEFFKKHPEYTIVHSHMDKMSGLVLNAAAKADIPVRIAHSHNTSSEGGIASKVYKWYAGNHITSSATHLYACSEAAANWLFRNKSKMATILNNGIEADKFRFSKENRHAIRESLGIEKDALILGHVGRFAYQKNHSYLLNIFEGVKHRIPNAYLLLAGDGPLKEKVMAKSSELYLDKNVKFLGIREDIDALLQAFDMFIFPSIHEGLPVTLIEAQGAGLPCVISDNITKEVDLGMGLVHSISLQNKGLWINKISNLAKNLPLRESNEDVLLQKGFDIRKTADITQTAYLSFGEKVI
ncbi:glycosyltransferase family 1 protein [Oceanobacillus chungangensis]|uniref:Glycosyltransferase family 1 protein n=1 Tax=Oceanobacillus chungangensis TaxID=1229152 RepID=A0A3D8PXA1_9BACI|nr:glycosyltransferase family 1 protein [Oceanobacillus chungangensis]RDW20402.1 glycosyltransferase family 1 protein [Oceanobacillus chungangensis]